MKLIWCGLHMTPIWRIISVCSPELHNGRVTGIRHPASTPTSWDSEGYFAACDFNDCWTWFSTVVKEKGVAEWESWCNITYLYEKGEHKRGGLKLPQNLYLQLPSWEESLVYLRPIGRSHDSMKASLMKHLLPWIHPSISLISLSLFLSLCCNQSLETGFWVFFLLLSDLTLGTAPASRIQPSWSPYSLHEGRADEMKK